MTHTNEPFDNIDFIRRLNRKLLYAIHRILSKELPLNMEERKLLLQEQERILGGKNSFAVALGDVADTELKIKRQQPESIAEATIPMDEKDLALVQRFLERNPE